MTPTSHNLRGILCMIAAAGTFVANDSCMKLALADSPPMQVLAMRGLSASLWCLPLLVLMGQGRALNHATDRWVVLRALCEFAAILCFIFALRRMPIADLTAITQTSPLMLVVAASLIWKERVGLPRFLLIGLGILGALMVAQPGSAVASPFAVFGFLTALGTVGRDLLSRRVGAAIPGLIVAFTTIVLVMTGGFVLSLAGETLVVPSRGTLLLMVAAGFLVMCGHVFIFLAFRFARPRVVAPFTYSFTIWAMLSGLLVFGDTPNALALCGMALIVASGLSVLLLEGRTRSGEASSPSPDAHVISN
jgi:drug/metabolite transporter (DMT)-like permease